MAGCCNCETGIAELQDRLNKVESAMAPFVEGHLLAFIQASSDVALFDLATGWGADRWTGWAIANGTAYTRAPITVQTYDMRNRAGIGAGASYTVGQMLGSATHTLSIAETPVHTHIVTDTGHNHNVTDPGHTHAITDTGHTHGGTGGAHSHTFTTDTDGAHVHQSIGSVTLSNASADATVPNLNPVGASFADHLSGGSHTHSGTTASASPSVVIANAATGISNVNNSTGINQTDSATTGIALGNSGSGQAHNNMQPSCAGLWVQKIYNV